jgi:hypothetical protein
MTTMRPVPAVSRAVVTALLVSAALGIVGGGVTAYLQGVLPASWNTLANSGAIWTLAAFVGAAALAGRQRAVTVAMATLVLVGEVAGYYWFVTDLRHLPVLRSEELLWTLAALWVGPLTGLAAHAARWGERRVLALSSMCGVLVGEGAYLWRFAGVPAAGLTELVIAAAAAGGVLTGLRATHQERFVAGLAGVLVAVGVYAAYRVPVAF